jgi:shikimate kinase
MNITLVGMPGSGKSFVGKRLAEKLGYSFLETDKIIEAEYALPLQSIVEKLGSHDFLDVEAARIVENCKNKDMAVISPGGSVIYRENTMEFLKTISKIVYLKTSLEIVLKRIGSVPRGIVNSDGKTFAELYAERTVLYEKWADYMVDGDLDADLVIEAILKNIPMRTLV